jgi:hypothetical protein
LSEQVIRFIRPLILKGDRRTAPDRLFHRAFDRQSAGSNCTARAWNQEQSGGGKKRQNKSLESAFGLDHTVSYAYYHAPS